MTTQYPIPAEYEQATQFIATASLSEQDKAAIEQLRGATREAMMSQSVPQRTPAEEAHYAIHHPERLNAYYHPDFTDVEVKKPLTVYAWQGLPLHILKARVAVIRKAQDKLRLEKAYRMNLISASVGGPGMSLHLGPVREWEALAKEKAALDAEIKSLKKARR